MTIQEFIKETGKFKDDSDFLIRPLIICNDGFEISVQASYAHYCNPRISHIDYYNSVEIGFPSQDEELIFDYAENKGEWTDSVYGYVPVDVVQKVIEKHNGINLDRTFNK